VVGPLLSPRRPLSLDWNRGGATAYVNIFYVILKKKSSFPEGLKAGERRGSCCAVGRSSTRQRGKKRFVFFVESWH
jgi:hypothetical protein